jgi:hypothetical protein
VFIDAYRRGRATQRDGSRARVAHRRIHRALSAEAAVLDGMVLARGARRERLDGRGLRGVTDPAVQNRQGLDR